MSAQPEISPWEPSDRIWTLRFFQSDKNDFGKKLFKYIGMVNIGP